MSAQKNQVLLAEPPFLGGFSLFLAANNPSYPRNMMKPVKVTRLWLFVLAGVVVTNIGFSQTPVFHIPMPITDTAKKTDDSSLRIRNLNPYFTLHVDSILSYQLEINRDPGKYFFFCASVPKYRIGSVPIPVCAAKAAVKE